MGNIVRNKKNTPDTSDKILTYKYYTDDKLRMLIRGDNTVEEKPVVTYEFNVPKGSITYNKLMNLYGTLKFHWDEDGNLTPVK